MIEDMNFDDLEEFFDWWAKLNPNDEMDIQEALTIYMNMDTYNTGAM